MCTGPTINAVLRDFDPDGSDHLNYQKFCSVVTTCLHPICPCLLAFLESLLF